MAGTVKGRLSSKGLYRIIRKLGRQVWAETLPHGIRHTAVTQCCKAAAAANLIYQTYWLSVVTLPWRPWSRWRQRGDSSKKCELPKPKIGYGNPIKSRFRSVLKFIQQSRSEVFMEFYEEPHHYEKTIFSDLQGAWENLRAAVADNHPFPESERLLFHIDEGMSWESVRNLSRMRKALLLIQNIANTNQMPEEVIEGIEEVVGILNEIPEQQ
jgi:hypothetical protein